MRKIDWNFVFNIVCIFIMACIIAATLVRNQILEGIVIDKEFFVGRYNDFYYLVLQGDKNGKEVKYRLECTQQEYESHSIGDYFKR